MGFEGSGNWEIGEIGSLGVFGYIGEVKELGDWNFGGLSDGWNRGLEDLGIGGLGDWGIK